MAFFPRVRTPCGRSAQVIIEGKGNTKWWWGKEHKQTPNQTKNQPKHPNRTTQNRRPEAESPLSRSVSSVRRWDRWEKIGYVLSMGLNSQRKSVRRGQRPSGVQRSQSKGLRSTLKTATKQPLHRVANRGNWVLCRSCSDCQQVWFLPKEISCCNAKHAEEKSLLVAQPFQLIARTKREAYQWSGSGGRSKRRELAD